MLGSENSQSCRMLHANVDVKQIASPDNCRLTETTIEPISFTVPRVKTTHFQDDLFPPTRVLWRPAVSGDQWVSGESGDSSWVSLRPGDMASVSALEQVIIMKALNLKLS